jgi:hypothetical protein
MPRRSGLILGCLLLSTSLFANDEALWREFGLVHTETTKQANLSVTRYRMKDVTGALAAWEWLRSPKGQPCDWTAFCTVDGTRTVINDDNYIVIFDGGVPAKTQVESELKALPDKKDSSLPAILSFLPRQGLVPDSAKYVLGPVSLAAFAPELASSNAGFEQGAEAQIADYKLGKGKEPSLRLALFNYATPEMARFHAIHFKLLPNVKVKRSGVLVAVVFGQTNETRADTLLSRVEYEAKITWNETPPPGPIKPLYQLLLNIIYLSGLLCALGLTAGLLYAGMRLYRRRFGTLEADEAMTTLHLR